MTTYNLLKFLHILAAFWFIAGLIGRDLMRSVARQTDDIRLFSGLSQAAGRFETLMVVPGSLLVVVIGVFVALRGGWPIFGFLEGADSNWLLLTNLLLLANILVVALIYLPRGKVFDQELQHAVAAGVMTDGLRARFNDPVVRWAHYGELASIFIIVALMVFKPF